MQESMHHAVHRFSSPDASAIVSAIDRDGIAAVENFVDPADLDVAQQFVRQSVAANGGNYLDFKGSGQLDGTFLKSLPSDPGFVGLCHGIYEKSIGAPAPDTGFYQVLRCLSGSLARSNSLNFHYDSYVLTALIPIIMPDRGKRGDLLIIPNVRRVRSSYAGNMIDKILLDNPLSQGVLRGLYARKSGLIRHVRLVPGTLYLFYGYRTIHTNETCDPEAIRSTALFHFADPHAESGLKTLLRRH
ncbi:hypothetical protein [Phreatobacter sp.]|uniref:hypothetical protein n=1 Tax=Phreatobacter sp. TaxID=1966341 RepID=UPI003F711391